MRGRAYPWHGRTVIPTFHPAAILHGGGETSRQFGELREDFELVRDTLAPPTGRARRRACASKEPPATRPRRRPEPVRVPDARITGARGAARAVLRCASSCETATAEDTRDVGAALAALLQPRDAVVLTGDLGAGKTTLVQGSAEGWASTSRSPRRPSPWSRSTGGASTSPTSTSTGSNGYRTSWTSGSTSSAARSGCSSSSGATPSRTSSPTTGSGSSSLTEPTGDERRIVITPQGHRGHSAGSGWSRPSTVPPPTPGRRGGA